jgi:nucleotide-binding universal stress UspA family protein
LLAVQSSRTPTARSIKLGNAEIKISPSEKKKEEHDKDEKDLQNILTFASDSQKYAAYKGKSETRIEEGDARAVIVGQASALSADYIIMGSRGLGAMGSLVGSVSSHVMQHAPCPVMIVRPKVK